MSGEGGARRAGSGGGTDADVDQRERHLHAEPEGVVGANDRGRGDDRKGRLRAAKGGARESGAWVPARQRARSVCVRVRACVRVCDGATARGTDHLEEDREIRIYAARVDRGVVALLFGRYGKVQCVDQEEKSEKIAPG